MFEYDEYMGRVESEHRKGLRYGQACYNVLSEMYPDIADKVRGTDLDPFYNDNKVTDFFCWLFDEVCDA